MSKPDIQMTKKKRLLLQDIKTLGEIADQLGEWFTQQGYRAERDPPETLCALLARFTHSEYIDRAGTLLDDGNKLLLKKQLNIKT